MKYFLIILSLLPILVSAQKNIGIGIETPQSRLHLHQNVVNGDPASQVQLTNSNTGSLSSDGLLMDFTGATASIINRENGNFTLGTGLVSRLNLLSSGGLGYNTTSLVGQSDFTLKSRFNGFGGMYVDSPDQTNGKPFYGYSINGFIAAYHYYDQTDLRFKLTIGSKTPLIITDAGQFLMNATSRVGLEDLTIKSVQNGFGGIYIDSPDGNNGKPFYGYGVQGTNRAFHYYDKTIDKWVLQVGTGTNVYVNQSGNLGLDFANPEEKMVINGAIRLSSILLGSAANGTIKFNGTNFYGRINGVWRPLADLTSTSALPDEETVKLKQENEELQERLQMMEERLEKLEAAIIKIK